MTPDSSFSNEGADVRIGHILSATCLMALSSMTCTADTIEDPLGLSTHSLHSSTSFVTINDTQSLEYEAPSQEAQQLGSMIGATYCAGTSVTASMSSADSGVDQVVFDWCNRELFSPFGMTASGSSSLEFSVHDEAMIGLGFIPDTSLLANDAEWSIRLTDEDGGLIDTLDAVSDSLLLLAGGIYCLEFTMQGADTRTVDGSTLEWGIQMAYASSPAVVPGAGGLALCLGFAGRRRRRRI